MKYYTSLPEEGHMSWPSAKNYPNLARTCKNTSFQNILTHHLLILEFHFRQFFVFLRRRKTTIGGKTLLLAKLAAKTVTFFLSVPVTICAVFCPFWNTNFHFLGLRGNLVSCVFEISSGRSPISKAPRTFASIM